MEPSGTAGFLRHPFTTASAATGIPAILANLGIDENELYEWKPYDSVGGFFHTGNAFSNNINIQGASANGKASYNINYGNLDDISFTGQVNGDGLGGNGITPVFLSSWMHFMNAEVAWRNGNDTFNDTMNGLKHALNKTDDLGGPELTEESIDNYIAAFTTTWNSSLSQDENMNLWATEYFIALTGNGIDGYNFYRRNGYPTDLQPNIESNPGNFPLSQYYPANLTTSNSNVSQKGDLSGRAFWNTGGATNLK